MPNERKRKKEERVTDIQGRMLPHSDEAERSVLACAMIDDVAAVHMLEALSEDMFYVTANRLIFAAMERIKNNRANIDVVTLVDALERSEELEAVGGTQYVTMLSVSVPNAANHNTYIEIVRNKYILRSIVRTCSDAISSAYNNEDAADVLNTAEKGIYDVAKAQSKGQLTPVSTMLPDLMKLLEDLKDPLYHRGIPTGFVSLNQILNGFHRGDLILLAARPSVGKTAFGMNLVANVAMAEGETTPAGRRKYVCAVFSLEMTREQLLLRLLSQISRVPLEHINNGKETPEEWTRIHAAREVLRNCQLYIDDTSLQKPIQIMEKCIRLRNQAGGLDLVMIDYLGLLVSDKENVESRQNEVAQITRYLKIMAKDLNVPVLLLSQLSRKVEQRQGMKPILSDLRESGAIEQDADIVMFIHREKDANKIDEPAQVIVAKHRNGKLATIDIEWHGAYVRFEDSKTDPNVQREQALSVPPSRTPAAPDPSFRAGEGETVFGADKGAESAQSEAQTPAEGAAAEAGEPERPTVAELAADADAHAMPFAPGHEPDEEPIRPRVADEGDGFADPDASADSPDPTVPPDDAYGDGYDGYGAENGDYDEESGEVPDDISDDDANGAF